MDLALKDIRRHVGKFVATIVGVAMLLAIVLVMNGIYQGNIADGVWLIENTATDLWVVERGRGGPFNESSRMPLDAAKSVAATPGVAKASPLVIYGAQRDIGGRSQQFSDATTPPKDRTDPTGAVLGTRTTPGSPFSSRLAA